MVYLSMSLLEGFCLGWDKGLFGGEGHRNGNGVLEHFREGWLYRRHVHLGKCGYSCYFGVHGTIPGCI